MKTFFRYPCIGIAVVMLVAVSVLFAGCTSYSRQGAQAPVSTPVTGSTPADVSTPASASSSVSVSLPYGVTISVPAAWMRQADLPTGIRDYGTTTVNIASFQSPDTIPGDKTSYNTLSIDIDQNPGPDFEKYFNNATLAVTKTYGTPLGVSAHSYTITISGYKSYELDFQTTAVKGTYIFTQTENGMYIFAFRGPNIPLAVKASEEEIVAIYKSIRL
jgi:hypothetical protein